MLKSIVFFLLVISSLVVLFTKNRPVPAGPSDCTYTFNLPVSPAGALPTGLAIDSISSITTVPVPFDCKISSSFDVVGLIVLSSNVKVPSSTL